jgi:hypothetical protein
VTAPALLPRQQAVARVCFAAQPSPADLQALGAPERWLLYRTMVRDRLRDMIAVGLPRTLALLGEPAFRACFDRWLDQAPPQTRYIREIVPAFVAFALPTWSTDATLPPWTADLARFETARWEVWYQPNPPTDAQALAFERRPLVNPALRVLRLSYPVHTRRPPNDPFPAEPTHLALFRTPEHGVDVWVLNAMTADLLEAWQTGEQTITESVREAADRRGVSISPGFIDKLSETMARFVERGVLLGSRPDAPNT